MSVLVLISKMCQRKVLHAACFRACCCVHTCAPLAFLEAAPLVFGEARQAGGSRERRLMTWTIPQPAVSDSTNHRGQRSPCLAQQEQAGSSPQQHFLHARTNSHACTHTHTHSPECLHLFPNAILCRMQWWYFVSTSFHFTGFCVHPRQVAYV